MSRQGWFPLFVLLSTVLAAAQDPEPASGQEQPRTSVKLASPQVLPGNKSYVTVLLTNAPEVSVAELEHWLSYPKDKLTFVSARLGISADLAKAELEMERPDLGEGASTPGEMAVLHFSVKGTRPIPDGPVVELTFDVPDLHPETITLPHRLQVRDSQGQEIREAEFSDAEIVVSDRLPDAPPAIFSCLFYMH